MVQLGFGSGEAGGGGDRLGAGSGRRRCGLPAAAAWAARSLVFPIVFLVVVAGRGCRCFGVRFFVVFRPCQSFVFRRPLMLMRAVFVRVRRGRGGRFSGCVRCWRGGG